MAHVFSWQEGSRRQPAGTLIHLCKSLYCYSFYLLETQSNSLQYRKAAETCKLIDYLFLKSNALVRIR